MGATCTDTGVNFAIFSPHATQVELLLFATSQSSQPLQIVLLDKTKHKTFACWHVQLIGLPTGTWYTWRMDGPNEPQPAGLYFDREKQLIDPWAKVVSAISWNRLAACQPGDNQATAMRCMVSDDSQYDWQGDKPLGSGNEQAIIYELHVGGFTKHPSAKVKNPGTFDGLTEKIPYLKKLGVTHVELLPIMAFDQQDIPQGTADHGLKNYWGYSTHSFFSPHPGYCVTPEQGTQVTEFRDMVKALHAAGIGIILDVVYNHTAEAGIGGPIINFRGIGNTVFYQHQENDKSILHDYTGCGNTINANHPLVTPFIVSSLEYWAREMHVDGFRFDLASALARGEGGVVLAEPPVVWAIELSEQLAHTQLIAEAWDAAGLYQVGSFAGQRWAEWNGQYRDTIRKVLCGDYGTIQSLANCIAGSSDLYQDKAGAPTNSINFITCHDGFTLYDLFSYNEKHNAANGEESRDGCNHNLSYNWGAEGASNDPKILNQRRQQVKNAFAILLLSGGIPMLLAGDELLNSQQGNNNGYCQDNELTWIDWNTAEQNNDIVYFVQHLIALRKRHPSIMRRHFLDGEIIAEKGMKDIAWHGEKLDTPLWDDHATRLLAFTLAGSADEADLHVAINMSDQASNVELPAIADKIWCLAVDTGKASAAIISPNEQQAVLEKTYQVNPKTVVVFENKLHG